MKHPSYLTPKKILRRPKVTHRARGSPIREVEVVSCLEPLPRFVYTIEEKGGGDRAPERPGIGGIFFKEMGTNRPHDRSRDVIDDLHMDHRAAIVLPAVNILQEQTTNDGVDN